MAPPALRRKGCRAADSKGDDDAQRHRQIHADAALAQVTQCVAEERCAGKKNYRQAEQHRGPAQQLFNVGCDVAGCRQIARHCIHHDLHHAKAGHQPAPQHKPALLAIMRRCLCAGCWRQHISQRQRPRQPCGRPSQCRRPDHAGTPAGGADLRRHHAGQAEQRALQRQRTRRAMHALHHHLRLPQPRHCRRRIIVRLAEKTPFGQLIENRQSVNIRKFQVGVSRQAAGPGRKKCSMHAARLAASRLAGLDMHQRRVELPVYKRFMPLAQSIRAQAAIKLIA